MDFERIAPDGFLDGKVVVITGASQGIGRAAAFGFAQAGARVALAARRGDVVAELADEINAAGGEALGIKADVSDEDDVRQLVETTVDHYGRLDGAFNNAGIDQPPAEPAQTPLEDFRRVLAVKVDGTFLCMKYQIPAMLDSGGGAIVNHGSVVGERAIGNLVAPCASQAAAVMLTKVVAVQYATAGIRANVIATGSNATPERWERADEQVRAQYGSRAPMRRPGRPAEVAQVAAWLLSDWCSYVTGAVVPVDGGFLAGSTFQMPTADDGRQKSATSDRS